jgi:predicted site-specific integrase-resolvase
MRKAGGQLVGYARVSTRQQDLALQLDALNQAGCERIFRDVGSGTLRKRPSSTRRVPGIPALRRQHARRLAR